VQGLSLQQLVEDLRAIAPAAWPGKDLTQDVVSDFLRRNPKYEVERWQHLLQDPFAEFLRELKAGDYYMPDHIFYQLPPEARTRTYRWGWVEPLHQSFFMSKLWEEYAVSCTMRSVDLYNVWQYICEPGAPHAAAMPCCSCGYVFPHIRFIIDPKRRLSMSDIIDPKSRLDNCVQESAHAFVCEYCVADNELCRDACIESLRTKWRQSVTENQYWRQRFTKRSELGDLVLRSKDLSHKALERSLVALYARREVARQADCPKRNRFGEGSRQELSWHIHDEIFYKYGFEVPLPHFLQNANRAAFLGVPESDLAPHHRMSVQARGHLEQKRARLAAYRSRSATSR